MSRQSMAPSRNPSLLEELEKLEQSITLTLQEIDSNFSRAHRIVTTSIIPVVQEYAKHSEAVWEGSKFWKQFFESSANVSLDGYEVAPPEDSIIPDENNTTQQSSSYDTNVDEDTITGSSITPPKPAPTEADDELSTEVLSSPSAAHAHSTPRQPGAAGTSFASYGSPYESMKRSMAGLSTRSPPSSPIIDPRTPAGNTRATLPDTSMTPESSPFNPPTSTATRTNVNQDPLLHQMLDKTYRIAATPHTARKQAQPPASRTGLGPKQRAHKPSTGLTPSTRGHQSAPSALDSSPFGSSPEIAAPQLRADIFSSPIKGGFGGPRTPGVSVMASARKNIATPAQREGVVGAGANLFSQNRTDRTGGGFGAEKTLEWDSDDDFEEELGFSPPKTMQFHVPQSRLLQTPAREASKRIVEDLLLTAGADFTDELDSKQEDDSPSVVRRHNEMDDTF
ncbi:hypothetical protein EJ05DRAFT_205822 [Pseudovirgaria hyperparasitica]|uniref:DASH complex subunit ASK1 n=1 Tax=Pseudovirgaria hyperparasitica TaxID=470096 RepID=A0A6A6WJX6_9PEZI|nr:uncharacterized protein EJ05DRAFT_205822 [Pseudovirgaria hyperparasitica]KAF2762327.1 hypothetical protein EJ05DRAFT_205822 [Pseudovirgaria hyperparasitica]